MLQFDSHLLILTTESQLTLITPRGTHGKCPTTPLMTIVMIRASAQLCQVRLLSHEVLWLKNRY